ncbi:aminotransferase class I/II-fold pyridoxal phosphate-dependent enzyme, partial [Clostridium saudiense]|nr:aminotransferase class I/II-fold pyridoxal phosphate-dependent enzyme [Clostridium saudiense]
YEKLTYDGNKHVSIASLSEDAKARTIVINGFSKTYSMTGWRVGYTASPTEIAKIMANIQSHMTSNTCSISQYAALEALNGPQEDIYSMISEFELRRDYMYKELCSINSIKPIRPQGAFYIMVNVEDNIGKVINGETINSSLDFARLLLDTENVAVIPGEAFGLDNYIRLSYATSMEAIEKGINRLKEFISKLK